MQAETTKTTGYNVNKEKGDDVIMISLAISVMISYDNPLERMFVCDGFFFWGCFFLSLGLMHTILLLLFQSIKSHLLPFFLKDKTKMTTSAGAAFLQQLVERTVLGIEVSIGTRGLTLFARDAMTVIADVM